MSKIVIEISSDEDCDATIDKSEKQPTKETNKPSLKESQNVQEKKQTLNEDEPPKKVLKTESKEDCKTDRGDSPGTSKESQNSPALSQENNDDIFKEFTEKCMSLDRSENMEKIVEKKLRKYYSLLKPEYRNSEQLGTFLIRKLAELKRSPSMIYVHIQEVVQELDVHRGDKQVKGSERFLNKLNKALEILISKIKKLEERDVDFEEEEDSSYLQLQRYRERAVKVYQKIQELEGGSTTIFRRKISFSGTQFPEVNKAIVKYVNAKGQFPDFHDILEVLKRAYTSAKLTISQEKLHRQAKGVFQNIGEQLQRLRQNECWEVHSAFLEDRTDPADQNEELKIVLTENKKKFGGRIDEFINKYTEEVVKKSGSAEDADISDKPKANEDIADNEDNEDNEEEDDEDEDEDDVDVLSEKTVKEGSIEEILDDIGNGENSLESSFMDDSKMKGPVSPPPGWDAYLNSWIPDDSSSDSVCIYTEDKSEENEEEKDGTPSTSHFNGSPDH